MGGGTQDGAARGDRPGESRERWVRRTHPAPPRVAYTCSSSLQGPCRKARSLLPPSARDVPPRHLHTNTQQFQPFQCGPSAGDLSVLCSHTKKLLIYIWLHQVLVAA